MGNTHNRYFLLVKCHKKRQAFCLPFFMESVLQLSIQFILIKISTNLVAHQYQQPIKTTHVLV